MPWYYSSDGLYHRFLAPLSSKLSEIDPIAYISASISSDTTKTVDLLNMGHTNHLELYFGNGPTPGLYRTVFRPTTYQHPIVGIRGTRANV